MVSLVFTIILDWPHKTRALKMSFQKLPLSKEMSLNMETHLHSSLVLRFRQMMTKIHCSHKGSARSCYIVGRSTKLEVRPTSVGRGSRLEWLSSAGATCISRGSRLRCTTENSQRTQGDPGDGSLIGYGQGHGFAVNRTARCVKKMKDLQEAGGIRAFIGTWLGDGFYGPLPVYFAFGLKNSEGKVDYIVLLLESRSPANEARLQL